jgi:hypothetical protein
MKRLLISLVLALALLMVPSAGALAATQEVTVTATPSYLGISNAPTTWTLNEYSGNNTIQADTIYYSNPLGDTTPPSATVVDGECRFTITNTSSVPTYVVINISNFTGGSDPMTNSEAGTNGAGTFGAYSWYSGMTYPDDKVIAKTTGSDNLTSSLAANTDLKWGMEVKTQSDAWTGGTSSTATITITVTQV